MAHTIASTENRTAASREARMTRRLALIMCALVIAVGACLIRASVTPAFADTESDLAAAQEKLAEVEQQLEVIANEYQALSVQQTETIAQIDAKQVEIDECNAEIERLKAEIERQRGELATIVAREYKNGYIDFLDVVLSASSFKEFTSTVEYVQKIYEHKDAVITTINATQQEMDKQLAKLESEMKELEALRATQEEQLNAMRAKQDEARALVESLDEEVKKLEEQKRQEELARAAAAASAAAAGGDASAYIENAGSGSAANVVACCFTTGSPGANLCAAWVSNVFVNAGYGFFGGDACDMYNMYCYSSDRSELKPGMIIAVSSNNFGIMGRLYGHIGIYIGNNTVMDNVGYIATSSLDSWINTYSTIVPARWGWMGGIVLS